MKKSQKGFTIIEVALVLAIGALIFLVVFLAVPALQRNQRNDARKRDVSNVVEAIADYNANNPANALSKTSLGDAQYDANKTGPIRSNGGPTLGNYLDTLSNNTTKVIVQANATNGVAPGGNDEGASTIYVVTGAKCDSSDTTKLKSAGGRQSAVVGTVENAYGYSRYCLDAS